MSDLTGWSQQTLSGLIGLEHSHVSVSCGTSPPSRLPWVSSEAERTNTDGAAQLADMKNDPAVQWRDRAIALTSNLTARGALRSEAWRAAVEQTPRHLFVPASAISNEADSAVENSEVDTWLNNVYSDSTLVVQRRQSREGRAELPTSSSTMPSLMTEMLEALDVHDGHRVLEIGTGTGYNSALLTHRLGEENVVSIDIDPGLVETARARLGTLGYFPTLIAGDGLAGAPDHGPYDRIIATCAVPGVPMAWIEQLSPGGKLLINLRGHIIGVLCLLERQEDNEAIGPVLRAGKDFMWLRQQVDSPFPEEEAPPFIGARNVARTLTGLSPANVLDHDGFRVLLQFELPGVRIMRSTEIFDPAERRHRPGILVFAADGSHVQAISEPEPDHQYRVIQGGSRRLWDTVETAHNLWTRLASPGPHRFGVVTNDTIQFGWLDNDTNWLRWPLPLA